MKNNVIAITMGDPAGIGPELCVKIWAEKCLPGGYIFIFIGSTAVFTEAALKLGIPLEIKTVDSFDQVTGDSFTVFAATTVDPSEYRIGEISPVCGKAAFDTIALSIELAKKGIVDAVVTNPIHKESLHLAGMNYPGHTEIFADMTNTTDYSMMFVLGDLCVTHVTTHCSLREAIELVTTERVFQTILLMNRTLISLGHSNPRIAVSGLNPHAGEGGLFGKEEINHIIPAINKAKSQGITVTGPYPPDTVFMRGFTGEFDGIVSMLHDHGFVALKSRDFDNGVNITAGLPIIRTSVGHGTAFDIAGKGIASTASLKAAVDAACRMASIIK